MLSPPFVSSVFFQKYVRSYNVISIFPLCIGCVAQDDETEEVTPPTAEDDIGASREGSRTDAEAVQR